MSVRVLPVIAALIVLAMAEPACVFAGPSCCAIPLPPVMGIDSKPAKLMPGLGSYQCAVKTSSRQAQKFFDQGLTLYYAFNFPESFRSFRQAARLDPHMAMAYWGMTMALGPNYNQSDDPKVEAPASVPLKQAIKLEPYASKKERALINALSVRISTKKNTDLKGLDIAYRKAMLGVYRAYPNDPDAAALYAESIMEIHAWKLWSSDGAPAPGTMELLAVLRGILAKHPDHLGANHFYIHAVEASQHPEMGLQCADRIPRLALAAGHIQHMPAHIYMRVGDYESAATCNLGAIAADKRYFAGNGGMTMYAMYLAHNEDFLNSARMMEGMYIDAKQAGEEFAGLAKQQVGAMPFLEPLLGEPLSTDLRFHRWDVVAATPEPPSKYRSFHAHWTYAQGLAAAAKGDVGGAQQRLNELDTEMKLLSSDTTMTFNSPRTIAGIKRAVLASQVARAGGDSAAEIAELKKAVAMQDALAYDEPEDFYYPVRETLGAALLRAGKASEAEAVFRTELTKHRHSGYALCGLEAALTAQGKQTEAANIHTQFVEAWKYADTTIKAEDL